MSLEQANIIDALGVDEHTRRLTLVIRQDTAWTGADTQLFQLQEKLNAYLSFALDGELTEAYPDFRDIPLALRIETPATPDARTLHMLAHVRQQLQFQDIELGVRVTDPNAIPPEAGPSHDCAGGCHCH